MISVTWKYANGEGKIGDVRESEVKGNVWIWKRVTLSMNKRYIHACMHE